MKAALILSLILAGCGGGGDGYTPVDPGPDPKCDVALVKLDGGPAACAPQT